jgi:Protein of unknown function (DUF1203)
LSEIGRPALAALASMNRTAARDVRPASYPSSTCVRGDTKGAEQCLSASLDCRSNRSNHFLRSPITSSHRGGWNAERPDRETIILAVSRLRWLDQAKRCFCFHIRFSRNLLLTKGVSPIFIREAAETQYVGYNEIPEQIAPRLMSVRAFDTRHYIVAADVTPGGQLGELAERFFQNNEISYLHVHHARWGCYVGRIDRA